MPSKMVTDRGKSAEVVVAAVRSHSEAVQRSAQQTLQMVLKKNEATPDFTSMFEYLARSLEKSREAMVTADDAHEAELRDDAALREARDAHAAALLEAIVELREVGAACSGARRCRALV